MRDYFKTRLKLIDSVIGIWDNNRKKYVLSLQEDNIKNTFACNGSTSTFSLAFSIVDKDFANASNTASAFQRIMGGIGRGLAGIVGFKAASINGLITARIGYDRAKDVASQKAAKHLVEQEFIRILPKKTQLIIQIFGE